MNEKYVDAKVVEPINLPKPGLETVLMRLGGGAIGCGCLIMLLGPVIVFLLAVIASVFGAC